MQVDKIILPSDGRDISLKHFKMLGSVIPESLEQWHPLKNGALTPFHVTYGSHQKVWWKCPKGDDHEWEATVKERVRNKKLISKRRASY
jgi:hypothetical protein